MSHPDLSICLVNYRTPEYTIQCIRDLFAITTGISFEVIVVENGSGDNSTDQLKAEFGSKIQLKINPTNRFFTGGFNDAIQAAKADYVLILNNDGMIKSNIFPRMVNFLQSHPQVGMVTGPILDAKTEKLTPKSTRKLTRLRDFVRSHTLTQVLFWPIYAWYTYFGWDQRTDREIEVAPGAFMMVRRDLFGQIGGFDETMKLYFTEEYLCDKIRAAGYKIWHLGDCPYYHHWCASTDRVDQDWLNQIYREDREAYFRLKPKTGVAVLTDSVLGVVATIDLSFPTVEIRNPSSQICLVVSLN